jgi:hypothetical protein
MLKLPPMEIAHGNKENMAGSYPLKDKTNKSSRNTSGIMGMKQLQSSLKEPSKKEKRVNANMRPSNGVPASLIDEISNLLEDYLWNSINSRKTGDSRAVAQGIVQLMKKKKLKMHEKEDSINECNPPTTKKDKQPTFTDVSSTSSQSNQAVDGDSSKVPSLKTVSGNPLEETGQPIKNNQLLSRIQELEDVLMQVMQENRQLHETILDLSMKDQKD